MAKATKKVAKVVSKSDIVGLVLANLTEGDRKVSKATVEAVTSQVLGTIVEALAEGDSVRIAGFGSFDVSHRAARTGRNPQTGATLKIAASRSVRFRPAKVVKEALNAKK